MYSVTFALKSPKSKIESLIYMFVFHNKQKLKVSTSLRVPVVLWDQKKRSITKKNKLINQYCKTHTGINERLHSIQAKLNEFKNLVDRFNLTQTLKNEPFTINGLRIYLNHTLNTNQDDVDYNVLLDYLRVFIQQIESGHRKQPNVKRYTEGTIKNYKNLYQAVERFELKIKKRLTWEMINKSVYSAFVGWHEDQGYSRNYIGKHIKDLKAIIKSAYEEGVHSNNEFQKRYFISPKDEVKKIPLSYDEVLMMSKIDLSHDAMLEFSKDIFLLGCCLGLRVSDIKRINPECIHKDHQGRYIRIKTQKTGATVQVPINSMANGILQKYEYDIPEFWEQVVNRNLKKIGTIMNLSDQRAAKLTLHISRHTFAKLSYELGIPSLYIMKITGHSTERNFLRYINISPDQAVDEFRKFEYFQ